MGHIFVLGQWALCQGQGTMPSGKEAGIKIILTISGEPIERGREDVLLWLTFQNWTSFHTLSTRISFGEFLFVARTGF